MLGEFSTRFRSTCVVDEQIADLNGREVMKLNAWLNDVVERELGELGDRYESMFENVNYHLAEANRHFATQRTN